MKSKILKYFQKIKLNWFKFKNYTDLPKKKQSQPKPKILWIEWLKSTVFFKSKLIRSITLLLFFLAFSISIYFYIFFQLPSPKSLKDYKVIPLSTHIYDRNGKLLYEIYREQNRTPVKLSKLPNYIKQSTIAIEDKDFYYHKGVSPVGGILRAIKDMLLTHKLQGGSTITQQLVKSALLTPERTIQRKLKEMIIALWAERLFSKNEILEMYLNQVPYGGASYGIEEASRNYFNKHAKDLSLQQAALLAGLPKAPTLYSPYTNPDLATKRRNDVLKAMLKQGYINKKQYDKSIKSKLIVIPPKTRIKAPHFVFYVKHQLEKLYGIRQVEEGGLNVTTTLDLDIQNKSQQILKDQLDKIKRLNVTNGAILVTRPPTGEILAMVGSYDYFATPSGAFNVTTALRQPGSSIKPINYAIGLERKLVSPATFFLDIPSCFSSPGQPKLYCPVNYDGQFHGPVQLRFALGSSYNIPAVKMMAYNGVKQFIASASAFTITTFKNPKRYGLSLALGGGEVKMTEMAQAFSTFANQGIPKKLVSIIKIKDKKENELYQFKDNNFYQNVSKPLPHPKYLAIKGKKAISKETSFLISHILLDNNARSAAFGPSSSLVIPKHAVSVKTGTTNNKRDNWTIGYTPNFLTVVWVGNNDNSPMNPYLTSGITGAAPIWNKVMRYLLDNQPDLWPIKPEGIIGKQVCTLEGGDNCPSRFEYFIKGTESTTSPAIKQTVPVNRDTDKLTTADDPVMEMKDKLTINDMFSTYCIDCNHEKDKKEIIKL